MKVKFEMSKFSDFFFKTGNEYLAIKILLKLAHKNILPKPGNKEFAKTVNKYFAKIG